MARKRKIDEKCHKRSPPPTFCSGWRTIGKLFLNAEKLDIEDKRGIGFDLSLITAAVSQFLRDEELPLGAYRHHGQRFGPALDDLVGTEGGGFVAVTAGSVEHGAVDEAALVVHLYLVSLRGHSTLTLHQHFENEKCEIAVGCFFRFSQF